jgi:hypothetical protein
MSTAASRTPRDPDETADIRTLVRGALQGVVANPDVWMETENALFGGRKPLDLVGTADEPRLREVVRAIKHGMFS